MIFFTLEIEPIKLRKLYELKFMFRIFVTRMENAFFKKGV